IVGDRVFYLILQRLSGNVSFARNWTEYENGFGDSSDFWIGLRIINELTGSTPRLLRVEAVTWAGVFSACEYTNFTVAGASTNYAMTFGSYINSNMSSDSLTYHKGMQFSTTDRDNDHRSSSCSNTYGYGGWWFYSCFIANPTGQFRYSTASDSTGMIWKGAATSSSSEPLKSIRLMVQLV
uniref:Fibrinogen C-terminal domain-containing protein n=1 Tax=Macrostomum lignano TaxID=282301 RepID=A0A1I8JEV2_9PLAT